MMKPCSGSIKQIMYWRTGLLPMYGRRPRGHRRLKANRNNQDYGLERALVEPSTTTAVMARLGTQAAGAGIAKLLRSPWARWRTSTQVSKWAKKQGYTVTRLSLYRWLARPDVRQMVRTQDVASLASATKRLRILLPMHLEHEAAVTAQLLNEILVTLIEKAAPSDTVAMASSRAVAATRDEAEETRSIFSGFEASILSAMTSPEAFEADLQDFQEWRRHRLVVAAEDWSGFRSLVRGLTESPDRGGTLEEWSVTLPKGLATAGAPSWVALALLSSDYGQQTTALYFLNGAIERGATPRNYWWARAALISENRSDYLHKGGLKHPLGAALRELDLKEHSNALQELARWEVETPEDSAIQLILRAQLLAATDDVNRAIAELEAYGGPSSGVPLLRARLLLSRARHGESPLPAADAGRALQLALRARDSRRLWKGPSWDSAHVAMQAAVLANDHQRAWRIVRPAPEGEATPAEAQNRTLRREALTIAIQRGELETAKDIEGDDSDPFGQALISSGEAGLRNDLAAQLAALHTAYGAASTDQERMGIATMLAYAGGSLPDVSDLEASYRSAIVELRQIAHFATGSADISELRARALESRPLTALLAERYVDDGNHALAAEVLSAGAERWRDPLLMRMAADRHLVAGEHAAGQTSAERALVLGGSGWAGEFDARFILLRAHEAQGHADDVGHQARQLVTLAPDNRDARWTLIQSQLRAGDGPGAWSSLTPNGAPIPPRGEQDVFTWIALVGKYDESPRVVRRSLEVLAEWAGDERVLGTFLMSILTRRSEEATGLASKDLEAFHEALERYTELFPESLVLRSVAVDLEDPLKSLEEILKASAERDDAIREIVAKGQVPTGALSKLLQRPYSQVLVERRAGQVRAHSPELDGHRGAGDLATTPIVLDLSAAATLALLDPGLRQTLIGQFSRVETTDVSYRDALNAQEQLGMGSRLSVSWDTHAEGPRMSSIDETAAAALQVHADGLVQVLVGARRKHWSKLVNLDVNLGDETWLSTLDLAISEGSLFWCDDLLYRAFAESQGVSTVGTVELLRRLSRTGAVTEALKQVAEATLICNYYIDFGFDEGTMSFAVARDEGRLVGPPSRWLKLPVGPTPRRPSNGLRPCWTTCRTRRLTEFGIGSRRQPSAWRGSLGTPKQQTRTSKFFCCVLPNVPGSVPRSCPGCSRASAWLSVSSML